MKSSRANGLRGFLALALLSGAATARAQIPTREAADLQGKPVVVATRIVAEDGRVLSETAKDVKVEPGKPLDRAEVAQSLRLLYRTGNYADLRAAIVAVPGGVRLDFIARENLYFNQVLIEGLIAPPSDASAAAATQLNLGQTYHRELMDEAAERLIETLHQEGLYTAIVTPETVPHAETHQMDVIFHVKPGARARVGVVRVKNETEYPNAELLKRLKMKEGRAITSARLLSGTDRIRKFLVKRGDLLARAVVRRGAYDAGSNTIPLNLEVSQGPRVKLMVSGAKFSKGELRRLVPVYQEGAVDADLLEEGKRNLRERLEREGYFDSSVDYTTATRGTAANPNGFQGTEEIITYQVVRGDKHKLVSIDLAGNHYFSSEVLRGRLQIAGGAFGTPGRFSRRLMESDAQSMRNLYSANGFLEAKVDAVIADNYKGKVGDLAIQFKIQEGKQTRVAALKLEGVHAFKEEELLGDVASTPGQPYSDFNVATDRDVILALYFNEGFPEANFTSKAERVNEQSGEKKQGAENNGDASGKADEKRNEKENQDKENPTKSIEQAEPVRLTYRIEEGPQTTVRRILYSGYEHTREGVIRRDVEVVPNKPLRQGQVVESQRRLYNLGVFNRVTIEPQNPAGTDRDKDLVVLVEEAKRYTLAYGGGFEVQRLASTSNPVAGQVQAAPRGILEISKLNLTGRADSLSLKLRGSTIEDRALLGYSDPNTFGHKNFSFQATAYTEKTQDINTFTEMRYEGSVQLTDQVSPRTTFLYRYVFRKVLVSNIADTINPEAIPLFQQPTLVSQFGVTWVQDRRDNPADATRGSFNSADFGVADGYIGSSASFLRFYYQNSTYHPIKRRFSFARSIRFGALLPYRDTVSLTFPPPTTAPLPTVIPLPERFFAGGGTSLRGFALNQAGPRDALTGFPVGGQALLVLNQEFRFPMRLPYFGTSLGGAFFYDGGNVFSRVNRISFRTSTPKPTFDTSDPANAECVTNCGNELNYFAHTVGFGIRYATPVGPIRVDLGYQINRPYFVVPCNDLTGAIPTCHKAGRLPGFQIFFNLGSSF
ncbi:MAG: BamA/TamA family outer membrane protein [Acidobacteriota bacterium]|nr:BamA/TamA family outer membrane protein [Acidobacteriota bacterium]